MNENIDLTKILKDCPKGTIFYSSMLNNVFFNKVFNDITDFGIPKVEVKDSKGRYWCFTSYGSLIIHEPREDWEGGDYNMMSPECLLFPSKDQRDWNEFSAPWYKKEKFDPNTLKPFDKVLIFTSGEWTCDFFSHMLSGDIFNKRCMGIGDVNVVIPYNDETKHLVGTSEEAPEYYGYWENEKINSIL